MRTRSHSLPQPCLQAAACSQPERSPAPLPGSRQETAHKEERGEGTPCVAVVHTSALQQTRVALHSWEKTLAEAEDGWGKQPIPYALKIAYSSISSSVLPLPFSSSLLGLSSLAQVLLFLPNRLKEQLSSPAHGPQVLLPQTIWGWDTEASGLSAPKEGNYFFCCKSKTENQFVW